MTGGGIRRLVDGFAEPLTRHLHDEIETLRGLDGYDSGRLREAYQRFEKSLMATDKVRSSTFDLSNESFLSTSLTPVRLRSIESPPSYLKPRTGASKAVCTTSRPYRFSCHMLYTSCLPGDTVACGASIRARFGGIPGNWPLRSK